jgi:hypothetical protein
MHWVEFAPGLLVGGCLGIVGALGVLAWSWWHFQVFGGENAGCIVAWAGDTSDAPPCQCKGFLIRYDAHRVDVSK